MIKLIFKHARGLWINFVIAIVSGTAIVFLDDWHARLVGLIVLIVFFAVTIVAIIDAAERVFYSEMKGETYIDDYMLLLFLWAVINILLCMFFANIYQAVKLKEDDDWLRPYPL